MEKKELYRRLARGRLAVVYELMEEPENFFMLRTERSLEDAIKTLTIKNGRDNQGRRYRLMDKVGTISLPIPEPIQ